MAKRGGFPGGMPGNMNNLMKQAQRMQRQMEEKQKELEEKQYSASAGGGAVTVTVSGKKEVLSVKLSEEVVDPDVRGSDRGGDQRGIPSGGRGQQPDDVPVDRWPWRSGRRIPVLSDGLLQQPD